MPYHLYHTKFLFLPTPYITNIIEKISGLSFPRPSIIFSQCWLCLLAKWLCSRYLWACSSFPVLLPEASVVVLFLPWAVHAIRAPVAHTASASPSTSAGKAQHHTEPLDRARGPVVTEQLHQQWHCFTNACHPRGPWALHMRQPSALCPIKYFSDPQIWNQELQELLQDHKMLQIKEAAEEVGRSSFFYKDVNSHFSSTVFGRRV